MNTVTTKDIAETNYHKRPAYDFFGVEWRGSTQGEGMDAQPVAAFGLKDYGISDLALYRTSARDQKAWYNHPSVHMMPQLQGIGDMGATRTSRRSRGFGDLGQAGLDFLKGDVMGIPIWALGAGAFVMLGGLGMLGLTKKRRK